jgi:hypothetical protein
VRKEEEMNRCVYRALRGANTYHFKFKGGYLGNDALIMIPSPLVSMVSSTLMLTDV